MAYPDSGRSNRPRDKSIRQFGRPKKQHDVKSQTLSKKQENNASVFHRNRNAQIGTLSSLQRRTDKLTHALSSISSISTPKKNAESKPTVLKSHFACVASQNHPPKKTQKDRSSFHDYPWQLSSTSPDLLRVRARHVEIVIPSWAQPLSLPPQTPDSIYSSYSQFPSPPEARSRRDSNISTSIFIGSLPSHSKIRRDCPYRRLSLTNCGTQKLQKLHKMTERQPSPFKPEVSSPDQNFSVASPELTVQPIPSANASAANLQAVSRPTSGPPISSLVGAVHQITGKAPPALVGASTTISGDKLYVFGGRRLSKRRTHLTQDMYELDLIQRHWTRLSTSGMPPAPRYFHSLCALGGTKLICYGGMAPTTQTQDAASESSQRQDGQQSEPGIAVMSDVHIYDIASKSWMMIPAANAPPGRYAHCATILPSYGVFTSATAPLSTVKHNPSSSGSPQGVTVDGRGGAEMIIVGGQDGASRYIEQISVFNLRSLRWTALETLGKSCGAYRSVVAPLIGIRAAQLGSLPAGKSELEISAEDEANGAESGYATLIYSNYNFLDVKLEMQIRMPDGTLTEKVMTGDHSPPGLRFPSGDIVDNHFLVSGTFLTSTKQEYALWALDLRTFKWSRIDAGPGVLTTGSWNRGLLWRRRNTFVILGDRRRKLADDYNHRRLNFTNICSIELEAFGLYDNPVNGGPWAGVNAPTPQGPTGLKEWQSGDLALSPVAQSLGRSVSELKSISDMDFLAIGGERVSVNSHLIARRWGPYFKHLLNSSANSSGDTLSTLHADAAAASRMSSITITPSSRVSVGNSTLQGSGSDPSRKSSVASAENRGPTSSEANGEPPSVPTNRSRLLYLPHTYFTLRALVYFLYTETLPPPGTTLCTPQILCSLLQLARPYRVDGLLEATVKRLHQVLDARNTAAVFNAAAMAAGGGQDIAFAGDIAPIGRNRRNNPSGYPARSQIRPVQQSPRSDIEDSEDEAMSSTSASTASLSGVDEPSTSRRSDQDIWGGDFSAVIGLQKRGLRGLMEGRRLRDQVPAGGEVNQGQTQGQGQGQAAAPPVQGQYQGPGVGQGQRQGQDQGQGQSQGQASGQSQGQSQNQSQGQGQVPGQTPGTSASPKPTADGSGVGLGIAPPTSP